MKKLFAFLLVIMMALSLAACGDTTKTPSGQNTPGNTQQDTNKPSGVSIVNASNEAWICSATNIAYVFSADGKYASYKLEGKAWLSNGNGTYTMETNFLTIDSTKYSVNVEGNTLTFTVNNNDYAYVKTSPFTPGQSSEGNFDEKLILPDGQAWIWEKNGLISGYVFNSDGTYGYYATDTWKLMSSGTWSTSGNTLVLDCHGKQSYTYIVNSDSITISNIFGDVYGPYLAKTIPSGE